MVDEKSFDCWVGGRRGERKGGLEWHVRRLWWLFIFEGIFF